MATRDITPKRASASNPWLRGPAFLTKEEDNWNLPVSVSSVEVDLEWVTNTVNSVSHGDERTSKIKEENPSPLYQLLWKHSDIYELKRRFAWLRRFKEWYRKDKAIEEEKSGSLTLDELDETLLDIIRLAQEEFYSKRTMETIAEFGMETAIKRFKDRYVVTHLRTMLKLTPYIDAHGLLRVGGRLHNSDLPETNKHQYILPKRHHVTRLLVEKSHKHNHFGGTQQTLAVMQSRYWIYPCDVNYYLQKCLDCETLKKQRGAQMMAPLPAERVTHHKIPFETSGVDYFGPFLVKINRSVHKRWIALFTCLSTRGLHLEVVHSLSSSSFLQALFRFNHARGSPLKKLVSDNATTFHGADDELKRAFTRLQTENNKRQLQRKEIEWKFNSPLASHQGGVWERLIRSIRKILSGLHAFIRTNPNDENLPTIMKEAEAIINARPLTHIRGDPDEFAALTPGMLLTGCIGSTDTVDNFRDADQLRRDWRYTQIAAEQFWGRFVREYLSCLQPMAKWTSAEKNLEVGDMILLEDQNMVKGEFPKAIVIDTFPGMDNRIRNVQVRMADGRTFVRDIRKIVPLELVNEKKEDTKN